VVKRSQATENGGEAREAFDSGRWWPSLFSGEPRTVTPPSDDLKLCLSRSALKAAPLDSPYLPALPWTLRGIFLRVETCTRRGSGSACSLVPVQTVADYQTWPSLQTDTAPLVDLDDRDLQARAAMGYYSTVLLGRSTGIEF